MKAVLLVTGALAVATTLQGQTQAKPDSGCTTLSNRTECRFVFGGRLSDSALTRMSRRMDSVMSKRAAIGVSLRATGTRRDTLGVFVESVTPNGPAESAGIVEGDRIAAINGVDLRTPAADIEDSYANGLSSHRLTREVQKLSPGARVRLRVYSGGRYRDVTVTAGKASDVFRMRDGVGFGMMGPEGVLMPGEGAPGAVFFRSPRGGSPEIYRGTLPRIEIPDLRELAPQLRRLELQAPRTPMVIRTSRTTT